VIGRREFITLIGGTTAWPLTARAQHSARPVVGILAGVSAERYVPYVAAFRQGLSEVGYVEGQNVAIEYRSADGQYDRMPVLVANLIQRRVTAIVVFGSTPAALAAKAATATIPIVFLTGADTVKLGLVTSLNRPGGNLTGVTVLSADLGPKQLELLHELVPNATLIALLVNPTNRTFNEALSRDLQEAARRFGLRLHVLHASSEGDFDTVFASLVQLRVEGLVIGPDVFFTSRTEQLAALTLRHAMPTIYAYREYPEAGGLMSYGTSLTAAYHQVGVYTGRILRGEKPADLPVQQVTQIELILNLKTAKTLGLTFPITLLGRADEVIE
jgi:putative ABC transport system substrate-binding protein